MNRIVITLGIAAVLSVMISLAVTAYAFAQTEDCDAWSYNIDIILAAHNARTQLLNTQTDRLNAMYDDAITDEEIDSYNAQVDAHNALVHTNTADGIALDAEIARFNAECSTSPAPAISTSPEVDDCVASGVKDGMNGGFNKNTWISCGGAAESTYYDGFISGCTYYGAFTVDYCKNFANGASK
jgi:hypothetical protein